MPEARGGEVLLEWTFDEYERHERGTGWYAVAALVGAAFLAYAFATRNFLFAVLIVMVAVVIVLRTRHTPERIAVRVSPAGIELDGQLHRYDAVETFWIVEPEHGRPMLYIDPEGLKPRVGIPIDGVAVADVRAALAPYVRESADRDEPGSDILGKVLKL